MPESLSMPDEASEGVGPATNEILELAQDLRSQWAGRNGEYMEARSAVRGDHWEGLGFARPPDTQYSLTANYQRPFVNKSVQMLVGQLPAIMVEPPSPDDLGRQRGERIEGVLYANWDLNKAHRQLFNVAWNMYVLRRGLIYYWWDPATEHVRWKSVVPDNFYPALDGEEIYEAVYVTRRLTRALRDEYPNLAEMITPDDGELEYANTNWGISEVSSGITEALSVQDPAPFDMRVEPRGGSTTVVDYYNRKGEWVRVMGGAVHRQRLNYPVPEVPFIEFAYGVNGDEAEPDSMLEDLIGLNQYFNQLLSQNADIIRKTADPPVIMEGTGADPAKVQSSVAAGNGSTIPIKQGGRIYLLGWDGTLPDIAGQMETVRDVMFDISGKPRSAFGQTVTNQSGVVTNLALTPTLQSNELDRTAWSWGLERLNERILQLYETFRKKPIEFKVVRQRPAGNAFVSEPLEGAIDPAEIGGWTENRLKWPSAVRVDDPVYVDMILKMAQASPQVISVYDAMEMLGMENVEARIERIKAEREDPRLHPEVLEQTVNSLAGLGGLGTDSYDGLAGSGTDTMSSGQVANVSGELPSPVAE